jgi:[ribosomal protein S5]-alanine N-acetyltransferase
LTGLRIETERLSLVGCPGDFAELVVTDHDRAAESLGVKIPKDWPHPDLAEFLPLYAEWLRTGDTQLGFGPWLSIDRAEEALVGSVGFIGLPKEGTVEIGFDTASAFRNRGYAAEGARALLEWGLVQEQVSRVIAHCDPDNAPSIRVLEKIGMQLTERTPGEQLRWEIRAV